MWIEFLFVFYDYIKSLRKGYKGIFSFELIFPLVLSVTLVLAVQEKKAYASGLLLIDYGINITSIIVGFCIAAITLLVSLDNKSIRRLKENSSKSMSSEIRPLSLYDILFLNFSYSILMGLLIIISNLIGAILVKVVDNLVIKEIFMGLDAFFIFHLLTFNIKNTTYFYFGFKNSE